MKLEHKKLKEVQCFGIWNDIEFILMSLNEKSRSKFDEFYSDFRGIAQHTGCNEIKDLDNPIRSIINEWIERSVNATLLDLLNFILKIGRLDVYQRINSLLENFNSTNVIKKSSVEDKVDDETVITLEDAASQSLMKYDAFILHSEDSSDIRFALDLKHKMEKKFGFKLCTKEDFVLGINFEHDAIMRLLEENRCDKLIVILSSAFFNDSMGGFISKYGQDLQIRNNKKIIPCAREHCGNTIKNLNGYSVLTYSRESKLLSFWDRLNTSLEEGRVSERPKAGPKAASHPKMIIKSAKEAKGILSKVKIRLKQKPMRESEKQ